MVHSRLELQSSWFGFVVVLFRSRSAAFVQRRKQVDELYDLEADLGEQTNLAARYPKKVEELKESGDVVAMIGDGINDAPALAAADIGVAIGTGTDVAIETADVTLMRGDLTSVPDAIKLSRATLRNIKQNLFWAFGYNIILIPVAAGVFALVPSAPVYLRELHPIMAAFAMVASDVVIVANALRLKRFKY